MIKTAIAIAWLGVIYGIIGLVIAFLIKFGVL
jgi:F0F1-type ATP synthase membrane subunit c/vacuolar-type H+-ATPase subunit K